MTDTLVSLACGGSSVFACADHTACCLLCPAEVDEFLQQTEKYIKDLTHRLVSYKAKEEAQEAALEAIAEVCVCFVVPVWVCGRLADACLAVWQPASW